MHVCKEVWEPDSKKCMHMPSSMCVLIWFFSIQFMKIIPWTLNLVFLYQFHAQKAVFKVPKICLIDFWIENDPPSLLWNFSENSSFLLGPPVPYQLFDFTELITYNTNIVLEKLSNFCGDCLSLKAMRYQCFWVGLWLDTHYRCYWSNY